MRALRFGLPVALSVAVALGAYATYPGNDALALFLRQISSLANPFDSQLNARLTAMIASAEVGPEGEVIFNSPLYDQRFFEPNSGSYWQISGKGQEDFRSRSLWDRKLDLSGRKAWTEPLFYDSDQFANEPLRVVERTVRLPGSDAEWQFVVARSLEEQAAR